MNTRILLAAVVAILTACGGGSGDDNPSPATSTSPLSKYVGSWQAPCDRHSRDSVAITESNGTLLITPKTEYFNGVGCTGAIVATELEGTDVAVTLRGTKNANVVLTPTGTATTAITVDEITAVMPQHSRTITGSAVTRSVRNGVPEWCIAFTNGDRTCVQDPGVIPAQTQPGGLYLQGNQMFILSPNGTTYTVDELYTRS